MIRLKSEPFAFNIEHDVNDIYDQDQSVQGKVIKMIHVYHVFITGFTNISLLPLYMVNALRVLIVYSYSREI